LLRNGGSPASAIAFQIVFGSDLDLVPIESMVLVEVRVLCGNYSVVEIGRDLAERNEFVAIQNLAADLVRARVLAVFILVSQGGMALGSATWGAIAQRAGIRAAFLWAGIGMIGTTVLGFFANLPDATSDLSPWNHWRAPAVIKDVAPELERGPALVTVEYAVAPERKAQFVEAMHQYERVRRRDGASRWGIFHDTQDGNLYLETFLVSSWAEHLRQHERQTLADRKIEKRFCNPDGPLPAVGI
jgi:hypothetical protein